MPFTTAADQQLIAKRLRKAAYLRKWHARPENKGKKALYAKRLKAKHGAAWVQRRREYSRRPAQVAQRQAYRSRPKIKAKLQAYERTTKRKTAHLKRRYGIGAEEKQMMLVAQTNRCAICQCPIELFSVHVDHCHTTNKVRGLLCANCNRGIGLFYDSPAVLEAAALYLRVAEL